PQAAELGVLLADGVDAGVGLGERLFQRQGTALVGVLVVGVGDVADGLGARLLPDRVPAHAVGYEEQVAVAGEPLGVARRVHRERVLVVAAARADVGPDGVDDLIATRQRNTPR